MKGYAFGGKKAQLLMARMKALRNPEHAKVLFNGKRPPDYPEGIQAPPAKEVEKGNRQ